MRKSVVVSFLFCGALIVLSGSNLYAESCSGCESLCYLGGGSWALTCGNDGPYYNCTPVSGCSGCKNNPDQQYVVCGQESGDGPYQPQRRPSKAPPSGLSFSNREWRIASTVVVVNARG